MAEGGNVEIVFKDENAVALGEVVGEDRETFEEGLVSCEGDWIVLVGPDGDDWGLEDGRAD